jgi:hypothetical protein
MELEEQLPQNIKVDVQFYDEIEKGKLLDYSSKDKIVKIVPSILEISNGGISHILFV